MIQLHDGSPGFSEAEIVAMHITDHIPQNVHKTFTDDITERGTAQSIFYSVPHPS